MKKILVSMMTIALVSALIGGGVYAAFSDTESQTGNAFEAGTIDLKVDGNATWASALSFQNKKPDATTAMGSVAFENGGTIAGSMTLSFGTLAESDDDTRDASDTFEFAAQATSAHPGYELNSDEYARLVYVTLTGSVTSWASGHNPDSDSTAGNNDGKVSVYELVNSSVTPQVDLQANGGNDDVTLNFYLGHYFTNSGTTSTTLTAAASVNDTTITVDSITDFNDTDVILIDTGTNGIEKATISGAPSGNTITVSSGLLLAHGSGVAVSKPNWTINTTADTWNAPQADGITVTISASLA